jgi:CheY-like chemotaxis protein
VDAKTHWKIKAVLFETGLDGHPKDPRQAINSWQNATRLGDKWAKNRLKELESHPEYKTFFTHEDLNFNKGIIRHFIVVADDDGTIRQEVSRIIQNLGHNVLPASNGSQVITHLENGLISGIILDLKMPEIDGFFVLRYIKTKKLSPKILVYTGYGSQENLKKLNEFSISQILLKPCLSQDIESAFLAAMGTNDKGD